MFATVQLMYIPSQRGRALLYTSMFICLVSWNSKHGKPVAARARALARRDAQSSNYDRGSSESEARETNTAAAGEEKLSDGDNAWSRTLGGPCAAPI